MTLLSNLLTRKRTSGNIAGSPLFRLTFRHTCQKIPPTGGIGVRGSPLQACGCTSVLCLHSKGPTQYRVISRPKEILPMRNLTDRGQDGPSAGPGAVRRLLDGTCPFGCHPLHPRKNEMVQIHCTIHAFSTPGHIPSSARESGKKASVELLTPRQKARAEINRPGFLLIGFTALYSYRLQSGAALRSVQDS